MWEQNLLHQIEFGQEENLYNYILPRAPEIQSFKIILISCWGPSFVSFFYYYFKFRI